MGPEKKDVIVSWVPGMEREVREREEERVVIHRLEEMVSMSKE